MKVFSEQLFFVLITVEAKSLSFTVLKNSESMKLHATLRNVDYSLRLDWFSFFSFGLIIRFCPKNPRYLESDNLERSGLFLVHQSTLQSAPTVWQDDHVL